MATLLSYVAWIAGILLGAYVVVCLAMFFGQRRLLYAPDRTRVAPDAVGLAGVTEKILTPPDGAQLVTWNVAAASPDKPTILYFHGNGGNLTGRTERIIKFQRAGYGLLMLSYRGYSGSTGDPSEANNVADAELAFDTLIQGGVEAQNIILFGESLGTGIAVQLASRHRVGAVILDAPYTSIADLAQRLYSYLPIRAFVLDRYESSAYIDKINAPLLVLHGARDTLIPVTMGRELFQAALEPKTMVVFRNGGHSDLFDHGAMAAIEDFIARHGVAMAGNKALQPANSAD